MTPDDPLARYQEAAHQVRSALCLEVVPEIATDVSARYEAAAVELVMAELKSKYSLNIDQFSSQDYKHGFSDALDQIDAVTKNRIAYYTGLGAEYNAKSSPGVCHGTGRVEGEDGK